MHTCLNLCGHFLSLFDCNQSPRTRLFHSNAPMFRTAGTERYTCSSSFSRVESPARPAVYVLFFSYTPSSFHFAVNQTPARISCTRQRERLFPPYYLAGFFSALALQLPPTVHQSPPTPCSSTCLLWQCRQLFNNYHAVLPNSHETCIV